VIEWRTPTERAVYLCDADGFSLAETPPGIQASGYNFTAYLKSAYLRELDEQNALVLDELHPGLKKLLDAAKMKLREHFRKRTAESSTDLVESWKRDKLYPFEDEPKDILEESKRQIFDVVALILAEHTWVFGEEFNLTVDDQSLTEVLKKHLEQLGRSADDPEPVLREDGTTAIVDLMLSRLIPQPRADEREHLVVELKRPSQLIDSKATTQIKTYAFAVADDERFKDTKTRWVFWAVSNDISDSARREAKQSNRPEGLLFDDEEQRIRIWVKSWGQIIETCRGRLFFQERLQYEANQSTAPAYLQRTHDKYLPKNLKKPAN
jgi:hypothetical protein